MRKLRNIDMFFKRTRGPSFFRKQKFFVCGQANAPDQEKKMFLLQSRSLFVGALLFAHRCLDDTSNSQN